MKEWFKNIWCLLFHNVQCYAEHPDVLTYNCHDCDREWHIED